MISHCLERALPTFCRTRPLLRHQSLKRRSPEHKHLCHRRSRRPSGQVCGLERLNRKSCMSPSGCPPNEASEDSVLHFCSPAYNNLQIANYLSARLAFCIIFWKSERSPTGSGIFRRIVARTTSGRALTDNRPCCIPQFPLAQSRRKRYKSGWYRKRPVSKAGAVPNVGAMQERTGIETSGSSCVERSSSGFSQKAQRDGVEAFGVGNVAGVAAMVEQFQPNMRHLIGQTNR